MHCLLTARRALCFQRMLIEFLRPKLPKRRGKISEDNEGAINLASNPIRTNRTKHIDVRHHIILRETVQQGKFELVHVCFQEQVADVLAKSLSSEAYTEHRKASTNLPW